MTNTEKIIKMLDLRYSETVNILSKKVEEFYYQTKQKVKFPSEILQAIFLKENYESERTELRLLNPDSNMESLEKLYKYLDLTEFLYKNLYLDQEVINIMKEYKIPLNPQNVHSKNLCHINLSNIIINGSFDDVYIAGTDFTGHLGQVIINPQKISHKILDKTILSGVTIEGSLNGVRIMGTNFTNSVGAIIDPQEIYGRSLNGTILADATIRGVLDGVDLGDTNFKGSKGAFIDLYTDISKYTEKTNFTDLRVIEDVFDENSIRIILGKDEGEKADINKVVEARTMILNKIFDEEINNLNPKKKIKTN